MRKLIITTLMALIGCKAPSVDAPALRTSIQTETAPVCLKQNFACYHNIIRIMEPHEMFAIVCDNLDEFGPTAEAPEALFDMITAQYTATMDLSFSDAEANSQDNAHIAQPFSTDFLIVNDSVRGFELDNDPNVYSDHFFGDRVYITGDFDLLDELLNDCE